MPAYNFQGQFADDVASGRKRQTIRATDRHAKPGMTAYLYTGLRTKNCRKLGMSTLVKIVSVEIGRHACGEPYAYVANSHLTHDSLDEFSKSDGFESGEEMAEWFSKQYSLPFNGFVHMWGDLK